MTYVYIYINEIESWNGRRIEVRLKIGSAGISLWRCHGALKYERYDGPCPPSHPPRCISANLRSLVLAFISARPRPRFFFFHVALSRLFSCLE